MRGILVRLRQEQRGLDELDLEHLVVPQIVADEVTSYLDDDGRRQVVSTIAELFSSPILISHTSEILDHATEVHRVSRSPLGTTAIVTDGS